jgi:hypothetical protein
LGKAGRGFDVGAVGGEIVHVSHGGFDKRRAGRSSLLKDRRVGSILSLYTCMLLHGRRANVQGIHIYSNGSIDASKAYFTS